MALFSEAATMRDISIAGNSIKNKLQKTRTKEKYKFKPKTKSPKFEGIQRTRNQKTSNKKIQIKPEAKNLKAEAEDPESKLTQR